MTKRDVVKTVLAGEKPPYVPWHIGLTLEARDKLSSWYRTGDLDAILGNHFVEVGDRSALKERLDAHRVRDEFGVVWNRSVDRDIGVVEGSRLPEPSLRRYRFPDPRDERVFRGIPETIRRSPDRYRVFPLGFALFERAWSLRGMENLLMDFHDNPAFVDDLLDAITDYNVVHIETAVRFDIDAVKIGDDWGCQTGLLMGYPLWKRFIRPRLLRMYRCIKKGGKAVFQHSCGNIGELFGDLAELGLDLFNPFQPEVMNVFAHLDRYRGRFCFQGGLSTQRVLPFGTPEEVRDAVAALVDAGREGGYVLSPAHMVKADVPEENVAVLAETVQAQPGAAGC